MNEPGGLDGVMRPAGREAYLGGVERRRVAPMQTTYRSEPASWRSASAVEPLVCVVDDDVSVRESVEGLFRQEGFDVDMFESAEGFLGRTRRQPPDCLVVDLVLPGMSGLDLHHELARKGMDTPT